MHRAKYGGNGMVLLVLLYASLFSLPQLFFLPVFESTEVHLNKTKLRVPH